LVLPRNFLVQIARDQNLSPDQEDVLLLRLVERKSYSDIAKQLDTSPQACQKRMGQVYRKFGITSGARGKETRLRTYLNSQWDKLTESAKTKHLNAASNEELMPNIQGKSLISELPEAINNNLPAPSHRVFVGREDELEQLYQLLSASDPAHLINITGLSGIGKTALALEIAYRLAEKTSNKNASQFQSIVFCSAQQKSFTSQSILTRMKTEKTIEDIFEVLTQTLDIDATTLEDFGKVKSHLLDHPTLLIIDNWETIEEPEKVLSFLYELPPTVKVIITGRTSVLVDVVIKLDSLTQTNTIKLLEQKAKEQGLTLTPFQLNQLAQDIDGVPIAIAYGMSQLAAGYGVEDVQQRLNDADGEFANFCFREVVESIKKDVAYRILMAISLFPQPAPREVILQVAQLSTNNLEIADAFVQLQRLSLIFHDQGRYGMFSFLRHYALAELAKDSSFEQKARKQWVKWYQTLCAKYKDLDDQEWQQRASILTPQWDNIQAVMDWSIDQKDYKTFRSLFETFKGASNAKNNWKYLLKWSEQLLEGGQKQEEWTILAEAFLTQAQILTRQGQPDQLEQAENLLIQGKEWDGNKDTILDLEFEMTKGLVALRQGLFSKGKKSFEGVKKALPKAKLDSDIKSEFELQLAYYEAESFYRQGDYASAQKAYEIALEKAKQLQWQQAVIAIQNWLGETAIELGNFKDAEKLVNNSLEIVQKSDDLQSIAFTYRTLAVYHQSKSELIEAKRAADEALDAFNKIGFVQQSHEIAQFLAALSQLPGGVMKRGRGRRKKVNLDNLYHLPPQRNDFV
jgi:AAA+ ATPase superfamily predicted ATPase/DNA-binding CsgD family transcriptional regulator